MALPPTFDEDALGGSKADYWPALYGDRRLEPAGPTAHRRLIHAYNAWVEKGRLLVLSERATEAVMADWKAFRERYLALAVVEGGKDEGE